LTASHTARAVVTLALLIALSALAIGLLSNPTPRYVHLVGELDSLQLPTALRYDMPRSQGLHLYDVALSLTRVAAVSFATGLQSINRTDIRALSLTRRPGLAASSATIQPADRQGPFTALLPAGSTVGAGRSATAGSLSFTVRPPAGKPLRIALEAETIIVSEANRMKIAPDPFLGMPVDGKAVPTYSCTARNTIALVSLEASCSSDALITVAADSPLQLLTHDSPLQVSAEQRLRLATLVLTEATFRGARDADISLHSAADIEITAGSNFVWTAVSITAPRDGGAPPIRLEARGEVTSLKQDGHQLLPSRLSDWLTAGPGSRGIVGGLALLLVSSWILLLKRAIDILAKRLLPE
jgi:hypothetical protein